VQLRPDGVQRTPERLVAWTSSGDPTGAFVKPDVVATAVGVLGATPPSHLGRRWDLGSGTSVAAARTSGVAASLLSRHDWSAAEVRSAIATTAGDVAGDPSLLRLGAGRARARPADRPGLVFRLPVGDYRAWLDGELDATALNTPSVLLQGTGSVTRTVTNVGTRAMYYSSTATGFGSLVNGWSGAAAGTIEVKPMRSRLTSASPCRPPKPRSDWPLTTWSTIRPSEPI